MHDGGNAGQLLWIKAFGFFRVFSLFLLAQFSSLQVLLACQAAHAPAVLGKQLRRQNSCKEQQEQTEVQLARLHLASAQAVGLMVEAAREEGCSSSGE
jgi:hypothetical protein